MACLSWILLLLFLYHHVLANSREAKRISTATVSQSGVPQTTPAGGGGQGRGCLQPTLRVLDGDLRNVFLCSVNHPGWTRYSSCYDKCDVDDSGMVCRHRSNGLHGCWLSSEYVGEGTDVSDEIFQNEKAFVARECGGVVDGLYVYPEGHTLCRDGQRINVTSACLRSEGRCEFRSSDQALVCQTKVNPVLGLFCAVLGLSSITSKYNHPNSSPSQMLVVSILKNSDPARKQPPLPPHAIVGNYLIETRTLVKFQMEALPQSPSIRGNEQSSRDMESNNINESEGYKYFSHGISPEASNVRNDGISGLSQKQPNAPESKQEKPINIKEFIQAKLTPASDMLGLKKQHDLQDFLGAKRMMIRSRRGNQRIKKRRSVLAGGQKKRYISLGQIDKYGGAGQKEVQKLGWDPSSPKEHPVSSNDAPADATQQAKNDNPAKEKMNDEESIDVFSDRVQKAGVDSGIILDKLPTGGSILKAGNKTISDHQQSKSAAEKTTFYDSKVNSQQSFTRNDQNLTNISNRSTTIRNKEASPVSKVNPQINTNVKASQNTISAFNDIQKSENADSVPLPFELGLAKTPNNTSVRLFKLKQSIQPTPKQKLSTIFDLERRRSKSEPNNKEEDLTAATKSAPIKKGDNLSSVNFLEDFINFLSQLSDIRRTELPWNPTRQSTDPVVKPELVGVKQKDSSVEKSQAKSGGVQKTDNGINVHFHMIVEKKRPSSHHGEEEAGFAVVAVQAEGAPAQRKLNVLQQVGQTPDALNGEKLAETWKEHNVLADALRKMVQTQATDHHRLHAADQDHMLPSLPGSPDHARENRKKQDGPDVQLPGNKAPESKVTQTSSSRNMTFPRRIVTHLNGSTPVSKFWPDDTGPSFSSSTRDTSATSVRSGARKLPPKQIAADTDISRSGKTVSDHAKLPNKIAAFVTERKFPLPTETRRVEHIVKAKPSQEDTESPVLNSNQFKHNPTPRIIIFPRIYELAQKPPQMKNKIISKKDEVVNNVHLSIRKRPGIALHDLHAKDNPANKSYIPLRDLKGVTVKYMNKTAYNQSTRKEHSSQNMKTEKAKVQSATKEKVENPFREKTANAQDQNQASFNIQTQYQAQPSTPKQGQEQEDSSVPVQTDSNAHSHGHEKLSAGGHIQQEPDTERYGQQGSNDQLQTPPDQTTKNKHGDPILPFGNHQPTVINEKHDLLSGSIGHTQLSGDSLNPSSSPDGSALASDSAKLNQASSIQDSIRHTAGAEYKEGLHPTMNTQEESSAPGQLQKAINTQRFVRSTHPHHHHGVGH